MDKLKLLYVDDEENSLYSFTALFRKEFRILTASSAEKGIALLKENPDVAVVLSDMKMPEMDGIDFLEAAKNIIPDSVRMLVTAYSDMEQIIEAINRAQISLYVQKPWSVPALKMEIENAIRIYNNNIFVKEKNAELQKTNEELRRFVYSASHDLRAPLMSMLGIVSLLKNDPEAPTQEYLGLIEGTIHKLDEFIKNIIDFHKNYRLDVEKKEVNLKQIIDNVVESLKYYEGRSDVEFEVNVNEAKPFLSDETRLRMILSNLASNAVKFQKPAEKNKKVIISAFSQDGKTILEVKDNGIGINSKVTGKVFDMFYRTNSKESGSGIGLYIVKETVEKLGGEISMESEEGTGTTIKIIFKQ